MEYTIDAPNIFETRIQGLGRYLLHQKGYVWLINRWQKLLELELTTTPIMRDEARSYFVLDTSLQQLVAGLLKTELLAKVH